MIFTRNEMTSRYATIVATTLLAAAFLSASPQPVTAQQAAAPAPAYTASDLQAVLNARIAALKAVIGLTPEQEKLWPPVEAAIRDAARSNADRLKQRQTAKPGDFLDILGTVADGEEARAKEIRKFIVAAKPLVATLTPEQRRRMPAYLGMTDYPGQPSGGLWVFQEEQG